MFMLLVSIDIRHDIYPARGRKLHDIYPIIRGATDYSPRYLPRKGTETRLREGGSAGGHNGVIRHDIYPARGRKPV